MKIIICIKQVPDTTDIKWTENNTIQREGVESVTNPFDVYAIEKALQLKKELKDVEITVLTMGPAQAETILRKAIAVGCDKGILISDKNLQVLIHTLQPKPLHLQLNQKCQNLT